ncbi:MAG: hypothetical protein LH469_04080 [Frankiaceae bacterium]|nr:hypothetical protein [Frankiaceae bacterium]
MLQRRTPAPTSARSAVGAVAERVRPEHLALLRTGAGVVMVGRPRVLPQLMGVDSATATRVGWAVQMLGAREIAIGLGTLVALRRPGSAAARTWVAAGVLTDALDVLAVGGALARGRVRKSSGAAVLTTATAAVGLGWRALQVDEGGI